MNLDTYLTVFERDVLLAGLGTFGQTELVPTRNGRLARTPFGVRIGVLFSYNELAAIDYYGLYKKSTAVVEELGSLKGRQVRMIEATVVHFASVRIEQVAVIAPALVSYFPTFKEELLRLRGFK